MSFADELAADRRLVILRALSEDVSGGTANENVLALALRAFGHQVGRDIVRADMQFLKDHQLITLEKVSGMRVEIWIGKLLPAGEEVAYGKTRHPGVARRVAD